MLFETVPQVRRDYLTRSAMTRQRLAVGATQGSGCSAKRCVQWFMPSINGTVTSVLVAISGGEVSRRGDLGKQLGLLVVAFLKIGMAATVFSACSKERDECCSRRATRFLS